MYLSIIVFENQLSLGLRKVQQIGGKRKTQRIVGLAYRHQMEEVALLGLLLKKEAWAIELMLYRI